MKICIFYKILYIKESINLNSLKMCRDKTKVLKGIANGKLKRKKQIKSRSLDNRLKKLKMRKITFAIHSLDMESINNLCRLLNDLGLDANNAQIKHLKNDITVFYINDEILKFIFKNWEKGKHYEKVLYKENGGKWKEFRNLS